MIKPLLPEGHELLEQKTIPFSFWSPPIDPHEFQDELIENMLHYDGVGLSANQIGTLGTAPVYTAPKVGGATEELTATIEAATAGEATDKYDFSRWFDLAADYIEDSEDIELAQAQIQKISTYLNAYAQAQFDSDKSNHINFQPLKGDFYLSEPIKKFDGILTVHADRTEFNYTYFDLDNQTPEEIPAKFSGLNSQTVLESKNFNKERGEWVRN